MEMATASGLTLLAGEKRDPLRTTTYGTGELIKAALDRHCTRLIIGIGGSATNNAGAGMARRVAKYNVPVIVLTGSLESSFSSFHSAGIEACFAIADGPLTLEKSLRRGPNLLESQTAQLFRLWKIASSSGKI